MERVKIKTIRARGLDAGMTLKDISEKMGISTDTLRRRIRADKLTVRNLKELKEILGLSIQDINNIFFN